MKVSLIIFLCLLAVLLFLLLEGFLSLIFLVLFATAGAGISLFLFVKRGAEEHDEESYQSQVSLIRRKSKYVVSLFFFICYGLSFLVLMSCTTEKPPLYFLFISLCAGLIALDISLVRNGRDVAINLAKSIILSLNIFLSSQIIFPYGIGGSDSVTHLRVLIYPMVETGHIPVTEFGYANFPFHHILVTIGSQILHIDPVASYNMVGGLVSALGVFIGFLLGRHMFDAKFGLVSALLFSGCSYIIYWTSHPAQLTYALPLFGLLLLTAFYLHDRKEIGFRIIVPVLAMSIIFCHPYSSIVVFIVLFSMWGVERLLRLRRTRLKSSIQNVSLMFLAMMLGHWIYFSLLFKSLVGYGKSYYEAILSESLLAPPAVYDSYPLTSIFLNTLGVSLLIMISVCGFLYLVTVRNSRRSFVVGYSVALVATAAVGLAFKFVYILPHRIFVFLEAFALIFLAAAGIRFIGLGNFKKKFASARALFLTISVIMIFFFSSSSTIAGFETSQFAGDQPYTKLYETSYERFSAEWIGSNLPLGDELHIYTGQSFSGFSKLHLLNCLGTDDMEFSKMPLSDLKSVDVDLIENNSTIVFSRYDIEIGFSSGQMIRGRYGQGFLTRLDPEAIDDFDPFDEVYDNGNIAIFQKDL